MESHSTDTPNSDVNFFTLAGGWKLGRGDRPQMDTLKN